MCTKRISRLSVVDSLSHEREQPTIGQNRRRMAEDATVLCKRSHEVTFFRGRRYLNEEGLRDVDGRYAHFLGYAELDIFLSTFDFLRRFSTYLLQALHHLLDQDFRS